MTSRLCAGGQMLRTMAGVSFVDGLGLRLLTGQQLCLETLVCILTGDYPAELPAKLLPAIVESHVRALRAKWVPASMRASLFLDR